MVRLFIVMVSVIGVVWAFSLGCNQFDESPSSNEPLRIEHEATQEKHSVYPMDLPFCYILSTNPRIGVYDVGKIESVAEDYNGMPVYTYVDLTLVEDWNEASSGKVQARMAGGTYWEEGVLSMFFWSASVARGERILLLMAPHENLVKNWGYEWLHPLTVFYIDADGFARNAYWLGDERVLLSQLRERIEEARRYEGDVEGGCPFMAAPIPFKEREPGDEETLPTDDVPLGQD